MRTGKKIKDDITFVGKQFDEKLWHPFRESGRMTCVMGNGRSVQYIRRIDQISVHPAFDAAPDFEICRRLSAFPVVFAQLTETLFRQSPAGTRTASWFILNSLDTVKCRRRSQASRNLYFHLPGAAVVLCQIYSSTQRNSSSFFQCENKLHDISVPLSTVSLFLDVQDKTTRRFQQAFHLYCSGKEPFYIVIG